MRIFWLLVLCAASGHADELLDRLNHSFAVRGANAPARASGEFEGNRFRLKFQPGGPILDFQDRQLLLNGTTPGERTRSQYYDHLVFHEPGRDLMYTFVLREHDVALQIDSRLPGQCWKPEATWFLQP